MKKTSTILWGIFFIFAAVMIVLNQLGHLTQVGLFELIYLVIVIPIVLKSLQYLQWFGVFIPLAIGFILFGSSLGLPDISNIAIILVSVFLSIGFGILFRRRSHKVWHASDDVVEETTDEKVSATASFSSTVTYINSDNFKRGDFKCSFGAMKIYFDNAKLDKEGAVINVDASFGGVEIYIPKEWKVIHTSSTFLGGIDEKNMKTKHAENAPQLTISGSVNFAGIEITYI